MAKKEKKTSNYEYLIKTDTSGYAGEWIAIAKEKIVAHGSNAVKVYKSALAKNKSGVSLAKVPREQVLVLKNSYCLS